MKDQTKAARFPGAADENSRPNYKTTCFAIACIREYLQHIDASNRETLRGVCMAIKNEFGEFGFALCCDWIQRATGLNESLAHGVWKSLQPEGDYRGGLRHA